MNKKTVGVYLSIPAHMARPVNQINFGPALRQEVVDRWQLCADRVYSVNEAAEADELASLMSNVEFVAVKDNRRVKITSITNVARTHDHDITIIANADCLPIDCKLMKEIIDRVGSNDLCMVQRSNISQKSLRPSSRYFLGIDVFIMGGEALCKLPLEADWHIGDSCWDYWFPFLLLQKGTDVYGINAHPMVHLGHDSKWNFKDWQHKARCLLAEFPLGSPAWGEVINRRFKNKIGKPLKNRHIQHIFAFINTTVISQKRDIFRNDGTFNDFWLHCIQKTYGPLGNGKFTLAMKLESTIEYLQSFFEKQRQD